MKDRLATYELIKINEDEYNFTTKNNLTYCLTTKKSGAVYFSENKEEKSIRIFRFSLVDDSYAKNQDILTRNTIISFIKHKLVDKKNDCFLFFINNSLEEDTHKMYRGIHRLKLFKMMMEKANKRYNINYIYLTNQHFILEPSSYSGDFVGLILKVDSIDYSKIVREFYLFSYKNSYKNS